MFDHISLRVRDVARTRDFLKAALAPLGITVVVDRDLPGVGHLCGLGKDGKPSLWIFKEEPAHVVPKGGHVAFVAKSHAEVDAFHAAAVAAGGTDDGKPGPRPKYHSDFYGAFVVDENGIHFEACSHHKE